MTAAGANGRHAGPSLFAQIAVRLALFALLFALLDIAIVVVTYVRDPESLAQELLTLEAQKISALPPGSAETYSGPAGVTRWSMRFIDPTPLPFDDDDDAHEAAATGTLIDWTQREALGDGYRITGVRSVEQNGQLHWLKMQLDVDGLRPFVPVIANELIEHVALPLVPLSLLMLAFNVFAVRRVLDPLRRAEDEVDRLDPENMALRLTEPAAPREVGALVRAVNRALDRLDASVTVLRSFTANAAHELRTPLSIMQLALDRLPEGTARSELQADTQHMTRLVGQMLDLAQADALVLDDAATVDLARVGRAAVGMLAAQAFDTDREISFEDRGPASAKGHAEAIFRIYRNLIDNALAHTPAGTAIEVSTGPGAQIAVRDHGPGIAAEDMPHIFERFWRKRHDNNGGSGLGMGIVKRLVDAHHGTITIENAPGGGALVCVHFVPAAPTAPDKATPQI
jgi:signal transduction histidine kinase